MFPFQELLRLKSTRAQRAAVSPAAPLSATAGFHLSSHSCISQWHEQGWAMEYQDTEGTDQLGLAPGCAIPC